MKKTTAIKLCLLKNDINVGDLPTNMTEEEVIALDTMLRLHGILKDNQEICLIDDLSE